ncbi:MAG TPA: hypothetical protein VJY31_16415 [Buttiauxella sp.]|nr:hypothetical protein [Buttiauxella sp.]
MDADFISLETMIAAQETANWTFWMMFATWFAGLATFSAVILSLYLANRKPVPKLKITSSASIISPLPNVCKQGYAITVANVGVPPVVVSSIQWEFGGAQKIVQFFDKHISCPMPKKLEHGESALFFIECENFSDWVKFMKQTIEDAEGKVRKLKIVVNLSTGYQIRSKVESGLIKSLLSNK